MKRLFLIFALLLVPSLAFAGENIKQKDTGATVWENQDGDQVPVGSPGLTIHLDDASTASTAYVVTHKTGNIIKIYTVAGEVNTTAPAILDFGVVETNGVHIGLSSNAGDTPAVNQNTISYAISNIGEIDSIAFVPGTSPNIAVTQGQAIWIHSDGASTSASNVRATIIIE